MKLRGMSLVYNFINILCIIGIVYLYIMLILMFLHADYQTFFTTDFSNTISSNIYDSTHSFDNVWRALFLIIVTVLIFISPILLGAMTITFNKLWIKNYIHKQTKNHYKANNMEVDEEEDSGSISSKDRNSLPSFRRHSNSNYRVNTKSIFDKKFSGDLPDLGLNYTIDEFFYSCVRQANGNQFSTTPLFDFSGSALAINYYKEIFEMTPIIYCNETFHKEINGGQLPVMSNRRIQLADGSYGYIYYGKMKMSKQRFDKITWTIINNPQYFGSKHKVFVILRTNKLVFMADNNHIFKLKIPFLIRKANIDSMLWQQKSNIYRFNMFLGRIAVSFY